MAKKIKIIMQKEGEKDICIKCHPEIKLSFIKGLLGLMFSGISPFKAKPINIKDLLIGFLLFCSIFVIPLIFFLYSTALSVVVFIALVAANVIYNKDYCFNFIKKRLSEGYVVEDEEHKKLLEAAGVFATPENIQNVKPKNSILAKVDGFINKLPFNGMAAKLPILQRFSKYANYAVCVLAVLLLLSIFTAKNPVDSYLDDYEKLVNSMAKVMIQYENGDITEREAERKIMNIIAESEELDKKYRIKDDDWTPAQKSRMLKIMADYEDLENSIYGY